jgi:pimeloyl-ACP methyl ester carboxylesterase
MSLQHRHIDVAGLSTHIVEGGAAHQSAMLFLHGWPEDWSVFEPLMASLRDEMRVVAIDLPGIGGSETPLASRDKRGLASHVLRIVDQLALRDVTLVGHDIGGMIVYAALHARARGVSRGVIMNVVVPGLDPWDEVTRNPHIWHFGLHAVPELPEMLAGSHRAEYFDYFYDQLAGPAGVGPDVREAFVRAYARPEALHAGFEWYRGFPRDAKDNQASRSDVVETPVLCLRGDRESGELHRYVRGLRDGGLRRVQGKLIEHAGHFLPIEQPAAVASALRAFTARGATATSGA